MKTAKVYRPMYGIKLPRWQDILETYAYRLRRSFLRRCMAMFI